MKNGSLHHKHLIIVTAMLASIGFVMENGHAVAQQVSARWKPALETITVTAAPFKNINLREYSLSEAFAVSASIPVPYSDLNLAKEEGADELVRRINVAARVVCLQLDIAYPRSLYPILGDDDCEQTAAKDGLSSANLVIAAAEK